MTEDRKPKTLKPLINNEELVTNFRARGGRVLHVHPEGQSRGVTFAYVDKGSRIEIATGCQHSGDDFTRKIGTQQAINHFNDGKTVFLPKDRSVSPTYFLTSLIRY